MNSWQTVTVYIFFSPHSSLLLMALTFNQTFFLIIRIIPNHLPSFFFFFHSLFACRSLRLSSPLPPSFRRHVFLQQTRLLVVDKAAFVIESFYWPLSQLNHFLVAGVAAQPSLLRKKRKGRFLNNLPHPSLYCEACNNPQDHGVLAAVAMQSSKTAILLRPMAVRIVYKIVTYTTTTAAMLTFSSVGTVIGRIGESLTGIGRAQEVVNVNVNVNVFIIS